MRRFLLFFLVLVRFFKNIRPEKLSGVSNLGISVLNGFEENGKENIFCQLEHFRRKWYHSPVHIYAGKEAFIGIVPDKMVMMVPGRRNARDYSIKRYHPYRKVI